MNVHVFFNHTAGPPPPPPPANQPYKSFKVPDSGQFVQIRHDYETSRWNFQPRAYMIEDWNPTRNYEGGFPDTFPVFARTLKNGDIYKEDHMPLSDAWQNFWFNLLRRACHDTIPIGTLKDRWRIITMHGRALTDFGAVQQGYADYILGLNLDSEPIRQKFLGLGGNILKVLGTDGGFYKVEAFDVSAPPPSVDAAWGSWWLVHWASQSTILPYGNFWRITDWSWLNYGDKHYGVPYMFISNGNPISIPKEWCKPIANGAIYSPYIP